MNVRRWQVVVAAGLLALGACSSAEEEPPAPSPTPTPTPDPTTVEPTPEQTPEPTWPLTGMPADDAAEHPAVAVKVENTVMARPQTGLEYADIVWEEMVEGGITRFNAVYHSQQPEVVGPIRSLRPMDVGISLPLGGPQVISGGQQLFLGEARAAGLQLISDDAGHPGFFRESSRRAPHNLYGTLSQFLEQAEADAPPPEQFAFAEDVEDASAPSDGEPAGELRLSFPSTSPGWTWDEDSERWLRDEAGVASMSAAGEHLGTENVVIIRVQIVASAGRDQAGNAVPETVMTGGGAALVASAGHTVEATWRKDSIEEPLVIEDADGEEILLAPGTTWVELLPADRGGLTVNP